MVRDPFFEHESFLKGGIADTLMERIFVAEGFKVYRFAHEGILPNLIRLEEKPKIHPQIRTMPDFIVVKNGKTQFVEVKYRKDIKRVGMRRMKKLAEFWPDTLLIIVTPEEPYIYSIPVKEYVKTPKKEFKEFFSYFKIEEQTVEVFKKLINKYIVAPILSEDEDIWLRQ